VKNDRRRRGSKAGRRAGAADRDRLQPVRTRDPDLLRGVVVVPAADRLHLGPPRPLAIRLLLPRLRDNRFPRLRRLALDNCLHGLRTPTTANTAGKLPGRNCRKMPWKAKFHSVPLAN